MKIIKLILMNSVFVLMLISVFYFQQVEWFVKLFFYISSFMYMVSSIYLLSQDKMSTDHAEIISSSFVHKIILMIFNVIYLCFFAILDYQLLFVLYIICIILQSSVYYKSNLMLNDGY